MGKIGRPRKHTFKKGDRIFNYKKGVKTRWRYIKETRSTKTSRFILVVCDCGTIKEHSVSNVVHGKSTGCKKCMKVTSRGKLIKKDSFRNQSLSVGRGANYFYQMKQKQPKRFEKIKKLGNGDLVKGYYIEQEELLNKELEESDNV